MDRDHVVELRDFRPGLISADPPAQLPPGAARSCTNVWLTRAGQLGVRPARIKLAPTAAPLPPATSTATAALGVVPEMHYLAAGDVDAWAGPAGSMDPIAGWVSGPSTLLPGLNAVFVRYGDKWCAINQSEFHTLTYNAGTGIWTALVEPEVTLPRGCLASVHQNLLFVSGNDSQSQRIWFSEPYAPTAPWDNDKHWFDVPPRAGGPITAIVSHQGLLYVLTARDGWVAQGYDWDLMTDVVVSPLDITDGCVAPRSVVSHPSGLYWMGRDGIYTVSGRIPRCISDQVADYFGEDNDNRASCVLATRDWIAWSLCAEGGLPNGTLIYDLRHKSWTFWNLSVHAWFPFGDKGLGTFQDAADGRMRYLDPTEFTDDGTPILWQWRPGLFAPSGSPFMRAMFIRAQVFTESYGGSSLLAVDYAWDTNPPRHAVLPEIGTVSSWEPASTHLGLPGEGFFLDVAFRGLLSHAFCFEGLLVAARAVTPA